MTTRVLLFDEQPAEGVAVATWLTGQGFETETWSEAEAALRRVAAADGPWLVLRHRRLLTAPDLGLLHRLRAASPVPAILRAMDRDDEADRVAALDAGADDYLARETSARELLARIRCVLRRSRGVAGAGPDPAPRFSLCLKRRELFGPDGAPRNLTSAEFDLLQILARQQGTPVARELLSQAVLRRPYHPEDRALDNLVLRLRRKLSDEGDTPQLIKSVRGVGYVFTGFGGPEEAPRSRSAAPVLEAALSN